MYKVKKGIDTMYFLRDEACTPIDLTEEEYSWMVGQLRAKRTADLKKAMTAYMDTFWSCGVAGACEKRNKGTVKKMS